MDDADVVSENTLERVLDEKAEAGAEDSVSMGDEPIDQGTDGLPIEARQAIEMEGGEGDIGSGVSSSFPLRMHPCPSVCVWACMSCVFDRFPCSLFSSCTYDVWVAGIGATHPFCLAPCCFLIITPLSLSLSVSLSLSLSLSHSLSLEP